MSFQRNISFGLSIYGDKLFHSYSKNSEYHITHTLIGFSWLEKDKYNGNKKNYSYVNLFSPLIIASGVLLSSKYVFNNKAIADYTSIPTAILNSRFGYILNDFNSYGSNFVFTNAYIGSKLDYFGANEINYWRYMPSAGIEIGHVFNNKATSFGVFLSGGVAYPIDFVKGKVFTKFVPEIALKICLGEAKFKKTTTKTNSSDDDEDLLIP